MLRQITIPKIAGRVLDLHMSRPPVDANGRQPEYDGREGRKWDRIISKILEAIEDYDDQVEALIKEARAIEADEARSREQKNQEIARINVEIGELDEADGQELVTIILESDEFTFIDSHWWELKIPHDRSSRKLLRPINNALEPYHEVSNPHGWVEVRIEDGKVVPVTAAESAIPKAPKGNAIRKLARR